MIRWCLLIWLGLVPVSGASESASIPAADAPTEATGTWSRDAAQRLAEISDRMSAPSVIEKQREALATFESRFETGLGFNIAHPETADTLSEAAVRDAQRELDAISSGLGAISDVLTQRGTELDALSRELSTMQKRAESLRDDSTSAPVAQAIRARIASIISEAKRLQGITQQRLNAIEATQNKVLLMEQRIRTARADLAEVGARHVRALAELQQPPLWRLTMADIAKSAAGSTRFAGQAIPGALRYARENPARVILHGAAWLVTFGFILYLRRSFNSDESGKPVSRAATRPVSASMLIVLLLAPLFHPEAPSSVLQILGLMAIVPLLRTLVLYLDASLHPALYTLAAAWLLERVTVAFAREIVLQRLALLVLSVTMIALFFWARSLQIATGLSLGPRVAPIVRMLAVVGIGASILSLLFNVIGNADLALLMQSTTVRAAILAAGIYAGVLVIGEIAPICLQSARTRGIRSIINHEAHILSRIRLVVAIGGFLFWLSVVLDGLHLFVPLTEFVSATLAAQWTIGKVTVSLGRVLGFVAAVWIAVQASRITQVLLRDDVLPKFALPRGVPNAISVIANYVMVLIGILLGAGILGIELSNFALIISALGVGIGFGLQNVVNNLVSGFILIFERAVQVGDTIQLNDVSGKVTQIGLRASRLRTFTGSEVIVPNGDLISNRLVNWTLSDNRRRLETVVGVAYGSDLERVHTVLREVLDREPDVLSDPAPTVVFEAFGDSALNFRLLYWIAEFDTGLRVTDSVNTAIAAALAANGIVIPFPQRDIHIRTTPD